MKKAWADSQARDGHAETIEGYPMDPPGWRLTGGMISLVNGLCARIPKNIIRLNHPVCEIQRLDNGVLVTVGYHDQKPRCRLKASEIILALPPRLAARSILFTPDLPYNLTQAMLRSSTWMAGHAKFFALYDKADWRKIGLSGQGFSQCGPLAEIHDGSGEANRPYGLTGFVGIPALRRKSRENMIRPSSDSFLFFTGRMPAGPSASIIRIGQGKNLQPLNMTSGPPTIIPSFSPLPEKQASGMEPFTLQAQKPQTTWVVTLKVHYPVLNGLF